VRQAHGLPVVVVEIGLPGAADVAQVEAPAGVETLPLARNGGLQARGGVGHAGEQGKRHEGACRQACQGRRLLPHRCSRWKIIIMHEGVIVATPPVRAQ
jgi:hypothetical protein